VLGDHARSVISNALEQKNASNNAQAFGSSLGELTAAAMGNTAAMDSVAAKAHGLISSYQQQGLLSAEQADWLQRNTTYLLANGGAAADASHDWGNLSEAQKSTVIQMENGIGAMGAQAKAAKDAHDSIC
jgi:hypothetical protein